MNLKYLIAERFGLIRIYDTVLRRRVPDASSSQWKPCRCSRTYTDAKRSEGQTGAEVKPSLRFSPQLNAVIQTQRQKRKVQPYSRPR